MKRIWEYLLENGKKQKIVYATQDSEAQDQVEGDDWVVLRRVAPNKGKLFDLLYFSDKLDHLMDEDQLKAKEEYLAERKERCQGKKSK